MENFNLKGISEEYPSTKFGKVS